MQMDKSGHLWTAYQMSRLSAEMWKWTGMNKRKAILLGGISGIAYPGIIEIQDGFSSKWGFSWGDMAANIAGAATYIAQELTLNKQRLQIKMSYWPYVYSEDLIARRNQLFGTTLPERILKDYNGQTYWISFPAKIFAAKIPHWLTMAIGYHAEGMLGGFENRWMDKNGNELNRMDIPRRRSLVLSPDIDFTKIKTNKKAVRSVLFLLNMVKVPAPAIFLSQGKIKGSLIYF